VTLGCRYMVIKEVGDGTFGTVWRAINKQSGEVVCVIEYQATCGLSVVGTVLQKSCFNRLFMILRLVSALIVVS
ncbi:hypothetical protein BHE74_00057526, partial [Ensete ventricosum]